MEQEPGTSTTPFIPATQTRRLFSLWCGVHNVQELKDKAVAFRKQALEVHPYKCIQEWRFITPRVCSHPAYYELLAQRNTPRKVCWARIFKQTTLWLADDAIAHI